MRLPPLHRPTDPATPAAAARSPMAEAELVRHLVGDALRCAAHTATAFDVEGVVAGLLRLGGAGGPGLRALVQLLQELSELRREPAGDTVAEDFEAHCQLVAIEAMAHAARSDQAALAEAYRNTGDVGVRNGLCEAAAKVPNAGPALFDLMVAHLEVDPFVAGLSLADHGDVAALPPLLATLRREAAGEPPGKPEGPSSRRALHVEGLVEAIEALGGRVPPELEAMVACAVAAGRPALAPLLVLVPPSFPKRRPPPASHVSTGQRAPGPPRGEGSGDLKN